MLLNQSILPLRTARLPVTLLFLLTPVLVLTFLFAKAGQLNWLLEVDPALLGFIALALNL